MTDLSKHSLAELEAEIERRKAEPDYAAWEPKWQAFREVMGWDDWTQNLTHRAVRALIAAHNAPFAGEAGEDGWTYWEHGMTVPEGVSPDTHETQYQARRERHWFGLYTAPTWATGRYRYRPKQTDEVLP